MKYSKICGGLVSLSLLLLLVGCSNEVSHGIVKGQVTYQGSPLASGEIIFALEDNSAVEGGVIQNGEFVSNAPIGPCVVRISGREIVRGVPDALDREDYLTKEIIPKQYNDDSTLRMDVIAGPQQKSFDLK